MRSSRPPIVAPDAQIAAAQHVLEAFLTEREMAIAARGEAAWAAQVRERIIAYFVRGGVAADTVQADLDAFAAEHPEPQLALESLLLEQQTASALGLDTLIAADLVADDLIAAETAGERPDASTDADASAP